MTPMLNNPLKNKSPNPSNLNLNKSPILRNLNKK